MTTFERLEDRRYLAGDHPQSIQFADESNSDFHFTYVASEMKKLGVTSLRLWFSVKNWNDRPSISTTPLRPGEIGSPEYSQILKRMFELKHLGFNVMVVVTPENGLVPTSAAQVTSFFQALLGVKQDPNGTETVADVVDRWEVGNEPDLSGYWADVSTLGKTAGIKSYVNKFLIPAATVLKAAGKEVISAGVSHNPDDMKTLLTELNAQGKIGLIDYAGYHPYANATYQGPYVELAKQYAAVYGLETVGTEWNMRDFGTDGKKDAQWAAALAINFPNVILPGMNSAYYFSNVNNFAARGGATSARPASVLKHDTTVSVTTTSPPDLLGDFYNSPLVPSEPFYSMYKAWQYGTVSGTVTTFNPVEVSNEGYRAFIDANENGLYDVGEYNGVTDAAGNYAIQYSVGTLKPGTYNVRVIPPGAPLAHPIAVPVALTALTAAVVNLDLTAFEPGALLAAPLKSIAGGSISGVIWNDDDADGVLTDHEVDANQQRVYIDLNSNGAWEQDEPSTLSRTDVGAFTIPFDAALVGGTYAVRVVANQQTVTPLVTLSLTSQDVGYVGIVLPAPLPPASASIAGTLYTDSNRNGLMDSGESPLASRVVYIDSNNNQKRDTGEYAVYSSSTGAYRFGSLQPGTYAIRFVAGASDVVLPEQTYPTITVAAGQRPTGVNIGLLVVPPTSIAGTVWFDANGDGAKDAAEAVSGARTVFIDANANRVLDAGELSTTTDGLGQYTFAGLSSGEYRLTVLLAPGERLSGPADGYRRLTYAASPITSADFGTTNLPRPVPVDPTVLQGELQLFGGGTNNNDQWEGFTGSGYADFAAKDSYIDFVFTRSESGKTTLDFRYANGSTQTRTVQIRVNDVVVGTLDFAPTGAWTSWSNVVLDEVPLPAGSVTIRAIATTDAGGPNFDSLTLTEILPPPPPPPPPVDDPITLEAENALLSEGTVATNIHAGYNGAGFADFAGTGSGATFAVTRKFAGASVLTFRYANGSAQNRPLEIAVDGVVVGTIACPPTGAWTNWSNAILTNVPLPAGEVTITALTTTSYGGANLDSLTIVHDDGTTPTPPPAPAPTNDPVTVEAENGLRTGGSVPATNQPGYTGTGFIDYAGIDSALTLTVLRGAPEAAKLTFRYANGSTANRPLEISINGVVVGTLAFAPTGAWTNWSTVSLSGVTLPSGTVDIRARATTSAGGANVDSLAIGAPDPVVPPPVDPPPVDPPPVDPPPTAVDLVIEAESAQMSGGTVKASNNAGYTGAGFADYAGQNSAVTYTISRPTAASASLIFRYANGSSANRPLQVLVNNVVVGTLPCAPTGSWTKWATASLTNVALPAGTVTIKAIASTATGGANIDSLTVTGGGTIVGPVTPPPVTPPPTTGTGTISGRLFMDANKNGVFDGADYYLSGKQVFLDLDGDNAYDANEKQVVSDANGRFSFTGLAAGTHKVRRVIPKGYVMTTPYRNITLTAGQTVTDVTIVTSPV